MFDFTYRDEGSVFLLTAHTPGADDWLEDNIPGDAMTWGEAIVVEHRYIGVILNALAEDGFSVEEE